MSKFTDHLVNGIVSPNIEDRRVRMGEGEYVPKKGQPLGWDYDTLANVMDEMGMSDNLDNMPDDTQNELLNELEAQGANNNDAAMPVIEEFLQELDPTNQVVKGMPPLQSDEDLSDQGTTGYWDAKNMGNGRGSSFQMERGKVIPADPVGRGPDSALLSQLLMGLVGK